MQKQDTEHEKKENSKKKVIIQTMKNSLAKSQTFQ